MLSGHCFLLDVHSQFLTPSRAPVGFPLGVPGPFTRHTYKVFSKEWGRPARGLPGPRLGLGCRTEGHHLCRLGRAQGGASAGAARRALAVSSRRLWPLDAS